MIHLSCMYVCTYVHICTLFMCSYWCAVCISTFRCEWMWVEQWRLLRLLHQQPRLLQLWLQRVCWFRPRWEALHLQTRVHTEWRYSHLWWWERTTMNGVAGRSSAHVLCMLVLHRFSIYHYMSLYMQSLWCSGERFTYLPYRHWRVCCWQWRLWPWLHQHPRQPHMSVRSGIWAACGPQNVLAWVWQIGSI